MLKNLSVYSRRAAFRNFATIPLTKDKSPNTRRSNFAVLKDEHIQYFEKLLGKQQVITNEEELQPFNVDWIQTVRGYSKIVLKPKTAEEISEILKYCNDSNLAVCPQGGNTGLVGGSVPVFDEVILSTLAMKKIIDFNEFTGVLSCESGCVLENLMTFLDDRGFIMPLDLGAKGSCHIGGNISTNAGGLRLIRYGSLHGTVLGLEAVLANGEIVDCMNTLRKNNTGYDLKHLFIGSEGTLGIVTKVAILCPPAPKSINLCFLGLDNYESVLSTYKLARSHLAEILSSCEMMDYLSVNVTKKNLGMNYPLGEMPFYMMIETSGSNSEHDEHKLNDFLQTAIDKQFVTDGFATSEPSKMKELWNMREHIAAALLKDGYFFKYDISLPLEKFYEIVPILRDRLSKFDNIVNICGFGHFGDGNLHLNVTTREYSEEVAKSIEPFVYQWTSQHRGSISAEHGIGFNKTKYLKYSKTPNEISLMKNLKTTMDPKGILNPYKVLYDHND